MKSRFRKRKQEIEYVERKYLYGVYCCKDSKEPMMMAAYVSEEMAIQKKEILESYGYKCEIRLVRVGR